MNHEDHREAALKLLAPSDREFEDDSVVRGAQILWSAAAHAVMAVAKERGWPHDSHRSLKCATMRLAEDYDEPQIAGYFGAAEKFLRHQYRDSMEDWERDTDRPLVHDFVERVVGLNLDANDLE